MPEDNKVKVRLTQGKYLTEENGRTVRYLTDDVFYINKSKYERRKNMLELIVDDSVEVSEPQQPPFDTIRKIDDVNDGHEQKSKAAGSKYPSYQEIQAQQQAGKGALLPAGATRS